MIETESGGTVLAVSGGVDSVVLLHMVSRSFGKSVVVAHINHGIRSDSNDDETFVAALSAKYGLPFTSTELSLGATASEELARRVRYRWLESVRLAYGAQTITTAHHQDDVLETMIINMQRGTGWRGLASLRDTAIVKRPLLNMSKVEIINYALKYQLEWREDTTNESLRYLRNRIRHTIIPRLTADQRRWFIKANASQLALRSNVDAELTKLCNVYCEGATIYRYPVIMADEEIAVELLRHWLGQALEGHRLRQLWLFAKTAKNGAKWSLDSDRFVVADKTRLIVLSSRD